MAKIHFILMGKGGVGKSLIATLLAQHLMRDGNHIFCADTDPTNPTFSGYPRLGARHFNIMTVDMNIDKRNFDDLIEELLAFDGDVVVDNGASSFLALMAYIMENNVIEHLQNAGKEVIIHGVLIGGLGMSETVRMLGTILKSQVAPVLVWENELFGPVSENGKGLKNSEVYEHYSDRILGIVKLHSRSQDTYGHDMHLMTSNRLTFDEVMESPLFRAMSRSRMLTVRNDLAIQLDTFI